RYQSYRAVPLVLSADRKCCPRITAIECRKCSHIAARAATEPHSRQVFLPSEFRALMVEKGLRITLQSSLNPVCKGFCRTGAIVFTGNFRAGRHGVNEC